MKATGRVSNKGITLIALVITIIVLLILAGVTIATLTGENGILTRAEIAKKETHISEEKEIVKLATIGAKDYKTGIIDESELRTELTNYTGGVDKYQLTKNEDTYEVTFEDCGRKYTINAKGKVTLVGESEEGSGEGTEEVSIEVSNLVVKNGETVLEENSKSVVTGTPLTISFDTSIEGGTITSIEPSLPYTPADSASVKLSETFTITGIGKNGKTITKEYTVNLNGYYYIPDLKVGDYVNYNPTILDKDGMTLVDKSLLQYTSEYGTGRSKGNGYGEQIFQANENIKWRILRKFDDGTVYIVPSTPILSTTRRKF